MSRISRVTGWTLCLLVGSGLAVEPPTTQNPPAILSGPQVREGAHESLVERGFDGRIRPLTTSPEERAVALLRLDEATRARVETILDERSAILDRVLVDNLDLLLQFQSARASGSATRQLSILRAFVRKLEPLRRRGSLRDEIARVLPEDQRARFEAMIDEYEDALEAQARADARARGERFQPLAYRIRRNLERLGQDIAASYERAIGSRVAELEAFLERASLSPASEREVRRIITEFGQQTMLRPTPADKRRLVRDLWNAVRPEERIRLIRALMSDSDLP